MKNRELFLRDPVTTKLSNNGQARINDGMSSQEWDTLHQELSSFVCEGQYSDGILRMLESFVSHLGSTNQPAAWVSGFYGSGKSHLLKMLGHLWVNTTFPADGVTARALVPQLPDDVLAVLKELDTRGRQAGGMHAVFGTLPAGGAESVRLTVLGAILRSKGLPENHAQAKFCLYLKQYGFYDGVKTFIEAKGKDFLKELNNLYVSPLIREALIQADAKLGNSEAVRELLKNQFAPKADITTSEFIQITKEVLSANGKLPLTVIVLDEVQLYIGDDSSRSTQVVELAEAICKQLDSRVLLVGAGQNALGAQTAQFGKLRDRFTIGVELSDQDVEAVTRKVLLAKKADKVASIKKILESHSGEISRQLSSTALQSRNDDQNFLVDDYPILPVRRRFWELVFRAVDPAGTSGMLRTQLRIIHDALQELADLPLGTVVPADFMFEQLQAGLVQQGVLLRELDERIRKLDDGKPEGELSARLCGLIFLIRKLPRTAGVDCGVRATPEMLADLLVSDLANDGTRLRKEIPPLLKKLSDEGVLLKEGDEYNLQTRESQEWEKEFRNRVTQIQNNDLLLHQKRDALLKEAISKEVYGVRLKQGASNVARQIFLHQDTTQPIPNGQDIPVWVRDEWGTPEKTVIDDARAAGTESSTVYIFIPKSSADELRQLIIRAEAAKSTVDYKGVPSTTEGMEARNAMATKVSDAEHARDTLVTEIVSVSKVYKGGGSELFNRTLAEKVKEAATDSLDRLFPRFNEADHRNWPNVISRARGGDDSPLGAVDFNGPTDQHSVSKEILRKVGSGLEGREIRRYFESTPFGWPQDAVDGAIIALHSGGHLIARYNGAALPAGQLDQGKISKTDFRVEMITLSTQDKIKLRALFQEAGVAAKPEVLEVKSDDFLDAATRLLSSAYGNAPKPDMPYSTFIDELRGLAGNERLGRMLTIYDQVKKDLLIWKKNAELAESRLPDWNKLLDFLKYGKGVKALDDVRVAIEGIIQGRMLIDPTDRILPLFKQTTQSLRSALTGAYSSYAATHKKLMDELLALEAWGKISNDQRRSILDEEDIAGVPTLNVSDDDDLLAALESTSFVMWQEKIAALPTRFSNAAQKAAKLLEPKTQHVRLTSSTLRSESDVKAWVTAKEKELVEKLKNGPVVIG